MFGGAVAQQSWHGYESGNGRGVDDVAKTLPLHHGIGCLDTVDDSPQIDINHPIPVRQLVILYITSDDYPGVVEQVVEPASRADHLLYQTINSLEVSNIQMRPSRLTAGGPNTGSYLLGKFALPIRQ